MCRALSPAPGPVVTVPLLIARADQPRSVASMTHEQRMEFAIRRAYEKGYISSEVLNQLPSVQQFVISVVVVGGVLVGLGVAAGALASTGVGAILEAIAAGIVLALAALGVITSAGQIIAGIKTLMTFYEATRVAQTHADLEAAGKDFATGIAEVGVGTVMMILSVLGARQGLRMAKGVPGNRVSAKPVAEDSEPVAAARPRPAEAPRGPAPGEPGSPEHKAMRWAEYQDRTAPDKRWSYDRWSKTYDQNMQRAIRANNAADAYREKIGWGEREVTVDVEGVPRRLDIADEAALRGVEYKTGAQSLTEDNAWEITRDEILVKQGWSIDWVFEQEPSAPLRSALDKAGVNTIVTGK
jgi:hypothetical protein